MTFQSEREREVVSNFLNRNNLFIHNIVDKSKIFEFLNLIKVFKTKLIRLGCDNDGGYLVPDDLEGIKACFSPGVDTKVDFENDLATKEIPSFLADFSVENIPNQNKLFTFEKKFLGIKNDYENININTWIKKHFPEKSTDEFILQMDIEGSEYEVLLNLEERLLKKFRILIIEFHNLNNLIHVNGYKIIKAVFEKILEEFYIVHLHVNNVFPPLCINDILIPPLIEFSFLRKDRLKQKIREKNQFHKYDQKNLPSNVDIVLPEYWY